MLVMDLDGVFADFAGAAAALHGHWGKKIIKFDFYKDWNITTEDFWAKIHEMGDEFYKEMVLPYPWATELLELVEQTDEFVIMTKPSDHPCGYSAKKIWIDKYLQPHTPAKIDIVVGSMKHLLAGKDRLLIDDFTPNCERFRECGGYAVEFPQLWNSKSRYSNGSMPYVREQLTTWKVKRTRDVAKDPTLRRASRKFWPPGDSPGY